VPDPGQIAVDAGLATRVSDNSVVFAPPPGGASVYRQAAEPVPATAPAEAAPAPVTAVAAAAPPAAPDLATLADDLYERIERRLRSDLLLERERRGSLPDF
jgi:hypothetical protein